jgi:hypothetical protein
MKDKNHTLTVRLNEDQFNFLKASADMYGVKPSAFLRLVIDQTRFNAYEQEQRTSKEVKSEHEEAYIDG